MSATFHVRVERHGSYFAAHYPSCRGTIAAPLHGLHSRSGERQVETAVHAYMARNGYVRGTYTWAWEVSL